MFNNINYIMEVFNFWGICALSMLLFSCGNANKDNKNESEFSESSYDISSLENQSSSYTDLGSESSDEDAASESMETSVSGDSDASESASSSEDWDEQLDSYDDLVDTYIKFLQKYQKGDLSALNEYMQALEKAKKYSEKLSEVQSMMTSSQMKRYIDITKKMTDAAVSLGM